MFYSLIVLTNNTSQSGGLFDFNATLPLIIIHFLALMAILNIIFYKPVAKILDSREEYIRNSLTTASATLNKADELTLQYEQALTTARKEAQELIQASQKDAQQIVLIKIKEAQKETEHLVLEASKQLTAQKEQALTMLEQEVDSLSTKVKQKLLRV